MFQVSINTKSPYFSSCPSLRYLSACSAYMAYALVILALISLKTWFILWAVRGFPLACVWGMTGSVQPGSFQLCTLAWQRLHSRDSYCWVSGRPNTVMLGCQQIFYAPITHLSRLGWPTHTETIHTPNLTAICEQPTDLAKAWDNTFRDICAEKHLTWKLQLYCRCNMSPLQDFQVNPAALIRPWLSLV
jgi:hypothetical protein